MRVIGRLNRKAWGWEIENCTGVQQVENLFRHYKNKKVEIEIKEVTEE